MISNKEKARRSARKLIDMADGHHSKEEIKAEFLRFASRLTEIQDAIYEVDGDDDVHDTLEDFWNMMHDWYEKDKVILL